MAQLASTSPHGSRDMTHISTYAPGTTRSGARMASYVRAARLARARARLASVSRRSAHEALGHVDEAFLLGTRVIVEGSRGGVECSL